MFNIEKLTKTIKDNLSVILLVPAVFGGLWQLFELSMMSISFIRFFSPTQLLPDGLLILFIFTIFYLSFKLAFVQSYEHSFNKKIITISDKKPPKFNNYYVRTKPFTKLKYKDNPIYRKNMIPFNIFIFVLGVGTMIYYISLFNKDISSENFISFTIELAVFIILLRAIIYSSIILTVQSIENKFFIYCKKWLYKKSIIRESILFPIKMILVAIVLSILIILPYSIFTSFHKKFFLPKNLQNLKYIENALNKKEYKTNKILYFNDKYIFIEHKNDNNSTIQIIKFEELFKQ